MTALHAAEKEATGKLQEQLQNDCKAAAVRLKGKENDLINFCKQTGRRKDNARVQVHAVKDANGKVVGFDRSTAQKATVQEKSTM